jgi:hypothetical protein
MCLAQSGSDLTRAVADRIEVEDTHVNTAKSQHGMIMKAQPVL